MTDLPHSMTSTKIRHDKTLHKLEGILQWCSLVYNHLFSSCKTMSTCNYHVNPISSALSFTKPYRNVSEITHKKRLRHQQMNCRSPRLDSCCKPTERIFGQVLDAAIGLLARTSMSQTVRKQTIGLLSSAEGGRILRSAAFKLAGNGYSQTQAFLPYTHTHTHTRTARHQFIYSTPTFRNFTRRSSYNACQVYRLWNRQIRVSARTFTRT
jgi:hypothetical protein